ncbi:glycosyltransferase family 4 protein [Paenibacillus aceris]|uniref:Glycosyltransferase involved in cell wall biosynthesis n=1 Tax=Paenibacillus aceris TaxID=869555 RepID=A0ABS4I9D4_9BACL|nr:glycosyltransferase [Paenibacillus aceris]MBP1966981.1 glycosyltransferase involved in cell wall biosynthesis [Paenibacillus aceris]
MRKTSVVKTRKQLKDTAQKRIMKTSAKKKQPFKTRRSLLNKPMRKRQVVLATMPVEQPVGTYELHQPPTLTETVDPEVIPPYIEPQAKPQVIEPPPNPAPLVLQKGVNLIGYIRTEIGIGEACRLMAKSFDTVELPFGIVNFADPGARSARNKDLTWIHKEMDEVPFHVNFFHMNASNLRDAYDRPFHPLGREIFNNRFNIGYWAWELPDFPDEWCSSFELVNEVWAPSQFIVDAVKMKSPHPVVKIPHAIHVKNDRSFDRKSFGLPEEQFLFLCMYDTHSTKARKNPQAVIRAFKKAFRPSDLTVGLVVKVNNPNSNPRDLEDLLQQMEGYSNIYLIQQIMNRDQVDTLINSTDCFVSLHRSEGFGLVMAEAMYLGKPVIGTNWSGNTDFMNADNSCPVNYKLVPVGRDIGPYKAHQVWAKPDTEHAAHYMQRLVQDTKWRMAIAHNGKQTIRSEYSPWVVGQQVKKRLSQLGLI